MGCRISRTIADDVDPCNKDPQIDDGYQAPSSSNMKSPIDKRSASSSSSTTTTTPKTDDDYQTKETGEVHNDDVVVVTRQQQNNNNVRRKRKIVLSTRFPVNHISYVDALDFKNLFKDDPFIRRQGNFELFEHDIYDNNCWTKYEWLFLGTRTDIYDKSFRKQLEEVKSTGGFMIQFMEEEVDNKCCLVKQDLGTVQKIQRDMAEQLNVKIFRVYRSSTKEIYLHQYHINRIITEIRNWYEKINNGCCRDDMLSECVIHAEIFRRKARVNKLKPLEYGRICCWG